MAKSKIEIAKAKGQTAVEINLQERVEVTLAKAVGGKKAGSRIMTHPLNVEALKKNGYIKTKKQD